MSAPEYWAVYFRYLTNIKKRGKINKILEREEGIVMASQVLMTISKDETERARLLSEYKGQVDAQSKIVHAKRLGFAKGIEKGLAAGMEKGIAEGRADKTLEIARNMAKLGLPVETIVSSTQLDPEKVKILYQ